MKFFPALLLWGCIVCNLTAQQPEYESVVAAPGDGIYSILRKQGLDPVKYYAAFITINAKDIKDGSLLHEGRAYKIPFATDSYKKTGVYVQLEKNGERPIFDKELGKMPHKSTILKDAVYYLILENQPENQSKFVNEIATNLAAKLMVHGAKVYIFGNEEDVLRKEESQSDAMGRYVGAVNKRYLQNLGKYQRLLMIKSNGSLTNGKLDVAVYHYDRSEKGQRFAENINEAFRTNNGKNPSLRENKMVFEDKNSLYLAKNILPAVSLVTLDATNGHKKEKIQLRSDKKLFADLLTSGILKDYADLEIED